MPRRASIHSGTLRCSRARRRPSTRSSRSWRTWISIAFPMEPETAGQVRRPAGLWLLTVVLLTSPVIHLLALFFDTRWLNFGSRLPWDAFVYFVIAPVVGALMLRRHERARFSVYVFLSCEILRAIRIDRKSTR